MNIDNMEKSTDKLFRKIKDTVSDYDFQSLLKVYSDNFNIELLEVLKSDLKKHLYFQEIFMCEDLDPTIIIRQFSLLVNNNIPIPFAESNSKKTRSYQLKISEYVENNVEEIKSYDGYRLETVAIKSPLYKILSDLISEIDVKEVFNLEELIFKYEFKNWRKFIELVDEKLNEASTTIKKIETLKWKGTKADFVELSKALILNDMFNGTQKEIVAKLSAFFEIDVKTYDQILNQIKGRNNGNETKFLDKIKKNLNNYFEKVDDR
ncbi:MAG: RteC domain-containing protein [Flavobacteriales bacterium]